MFLTTLPDCVYAVKKIAVLLHKQILLSRFMKTPTVMNKKSLFYILGVLCIIASIAMYLIGKGSSHLSELSDFWWIPLPLGALALLLANRK